MVVFLYTGLISSFALGAALFLFFSRRYPPGNALYFLIPILMCVALTVFVVEQRILSEGVRMTAAKEIYMDLMRSGVCVSQPSYAPIAITNKTWSWD